MVLVVGTTLALGSAMSQAGMKVYVKLNMSIDLVDDGGDPINDKGEYTYVTSNSSRFGFKGKSDLGAGLSAIFQIESSVTADAGGGTIAGRDTYVGLKGGFGQVRIGKNQTPHKWLRGRVTLFSDTYGDVRNIIRGKANGGDYERRESNSVVYWSNNLNGVKFGVLYRPEDGTHDKTTTSLGGYYKKGPLMAGLATVTVGKGHFGPTAEDTTSTEFAGSYKAGSAKIGLFVRNIEDIAGVKGIDMDVTGINVSFKSGVNTFKLANFMVEMSGKRSGVAIKDEDHSILSLGVDHKLSKSFTAYAVYAVISNDSASKVGFNGGGQGQKVNGVVLGKDVTALQIGVIGKF